MVSMENWRAMPNTIAKVLSEERVQCDQIIPFFRSCQKLFFYIKYPCFPNVVKSLRKNDFLSTKGTYTMLPFVSSKTLFPQSWIQKSQRNQRSKLPTSVGSLKKQDSSRKTSASLTIPKPFTVLITTNCGKFCKRWEYQIT